MSGFYHNGERKFRPGVYKRIVNSGDTSTFSAVPPYTPIQPSEPEPEPELAYLAVTPEGVLYAVGQALSLSADGGTVVIDRKIDTAIYGETLVVTNHR